MINKFLTLSMVSALSLAAAANANAAVNVMDPTYMPKAGEGYLKASTTFLNISDDSDDDGISNVNRNQFQAGFGLGNGFTLQIGTTPERGSVSYDKDFQATVGLNYRIIDTNNKLDVYAAWDMQLADKDADYDSNQFNLGVKFGQDHGSITYNVGAELNYTLSAESEGGSTFKMEKDSVLSYGINGEVMFKINDKFSTNLNLALLMYGDQDLTNKIASTKGTMEYDMSYRAGLALNYQFRDNVTLTGKLSYETFNEGEEKWGNTKTDHDSIDEIGLGFGVAVAF